MAVKKVSLVLACTSTLSKVLKILLFTLCFVVFITNVILTLQYTFPVPVYKNINLTLMTSFSNNPDRHVIESNTVRNWAQLGNDVKCLNWYINETDTTNEEYNWINIATNHTNHNLPVVRYLFLEGMDLSDTLYYGYANGDILFNSKLLETLRAVHDYHQRRHSGEPFLMIGRRIDVNVSDINNQTLQNLTSLAANKTLRGWATIDYVITSPLYPWYDLMDVVIARIGWDNYIVSYAHDHQIITYDVTATVLAVHQSYSGSGNSGFNTDNIDLNYGILMKQRRDMIGHILQNGQIKHTTYIVDEDENEFNFERRNVTI